MVKDNKLDKCENFLNLEDILDVTNFTSTKYAISDFFLRINMIATALGICVDFFLVTVLIF